MTLHVNYRFKKKITALQDYSKNQTFKCTYLIAVGQIKSPLEKHNRPLVIIKKNIHFRIAIIHRFNHITIANAGL